MEQYLQYLLIISVLTGLVIGAYFAFRNSGLGKFLGNLFGDANAMLGWLNNQLEECSQNGLTSSSCSIGPWIIGGLVIAGVLGLLKFASLLKPLLPEGTRKYNEITGKEDMDVSIDDYKAAEARYAEKLADGTLPKDIQDLRSKLDPSYKTSFDKIMIDQQATRDATARRKADVQKSSSGSAERQAASEAIDAQQSAISKSSVNDFTEETGDANPNDEDIVEAREF